MTYSQQKWTVECFSCKKSREISYKHLCRLDNQERPNICKSCTAKRRHSEGKIPYAPKLAKRVDFRCPGCEKIRTISRIRWKAIKQGRGTGLCHSCAARISNANRTVKTWKKKKKVYNVDGDNKQTRTKPIERLFSDVDS